jgi:hypothetical protein
MKSLFLILITCFLPLIVSAQKVTMENLQGTWKLSTYSVQGVSIDVETGTISASKETETRTSPAFLAQIKENIKQYAEPIKTSYIYITGNNIRKIIADIVNDGPFTLKEKNGKQFIDANYDNGTTGQMAVNMIDGKPHITEARTQKEFIYTRQ